MHVVSNVACLFVPEYYIVDKRATCSIHKDGGVVRPEKWQSPQSHTSYTMKTKHNSQDLTKLMTCICRTLSHPVHIFISLAEINENRPP